MRYIAFILQTLKRFAIEFIEVIFDKFQILYYKCYLCDMCEYDVDISFLIFNCHKKIKTPHEYKNVLC